MADLKLSDVGKTYGGAVEVLKHIDLDIKAGELIVFVGPSGCGKSTLLRMIAGLEKISAGTLEIDGQRVNDVPPAQRGIAMVFQSYALYPHMTVRDNMVFALQIAKKSKEEIEESVQRAAKMLQLTDYLDRLPKALSGGQRQRVAIGRAIVREPEVFLFDEPLSNLDAELRVQMRLELTRLHKQIGATMIYVTHDQVEAMTMADKIVVLRAGHIEQVGSPLDLYRTPRNRFVAEFIGSPKMNIVDGEEASRHDAHAIGIRPEHIDVGEGPWEGTVGVSEHLGSDTFFHVHDTGLADVVTVRAPGENSHRAGDRISLSPQMDKLHRFDREGLRIA